MTQLERRKKEVELARVKMAKMELELKIDEKLDEVARLQDFVKVQDTKIDELTKDLAN